MYLLIIANSCLWLFDPSSFLGVFFLFFFAKAIFCHLVSMKGNNRKSQRRLSRIS